MRSGQQYTATYGGQQYTATYGGGGEHHVTRVLAKQIVNDEQGVVNWVWNHHLIMIHPHTDTVCKQDASGWVWGFLFYCYGGVRQGGYGVMVARQQIAGAKSQNIQTSRVSV